MGLLSNPKSREKIVSIISRYNNPLCILCYLIGVCWFFGLAYKPLNAGVYFSENALLPGLVKEEFREDKDASNFLDSLKEELRRLKNMKEDSEERYHIPTSWMEEKFQSLGLDTYVQNFSFMYPAEIMRGQVFKGQNVYGILRAPRTANTEALVLSVPYRPPEGLENEKTYPGIALMLALAKSFRKHSYWAKDIIFLVTELESIGMQAWLGAYHADHSEYIHAGELGGRSGSIQAAINLEMAHESISRMNIKIEGLNGQLPNLDLVNTVARLCRNQNIPTNIQKRTNGPGGDSFDSFKHSLQTMMLMMWNQASGIPTGNHGLFHRYRIEAVTLQSMKMKGTRATFDFFPMGRLLEGIFRSMNNLLERFHQSFFFYLLPATDRYVSIGLYMPPFGLMAVPVIIKALSLWIAHSYRTPVNDKDKGKKETENEGEGEKEEGDRSAEQEETSDKAEEEGESSDKTEDTATQSSTDVEPDKQEAGLLSICPVIIMSVVFGLLAYRGPKYVIDTAEPFRMGAGDGLLFGTIALMISAMVFPKILCRKLKQRQSSSGPNPYLLKCFALLMLGTLLGVTSVLNISLAFFLALIWTPVMLIVWPSKSRIVNLFQYILLSLVSPLGLLLVGGAVNHLITTKTAINWTILDTLPSKTMETVQRALVTAVVDGELLGNWILTLSTLVILPTWLMFWALIWAEPMVIDVEQKPKKD